MMKAKRLIIVAVGGQGNLLASRVLAEAALASGVPIRMSEIHGMAQRGGVVESALVFGDARSPIISDAEADVLVGFEPAETLRALNRCNPESVVITNLDPLPPFTVSIGKGAYPDIRRLQDLIQAKTQKLIAFDASDLARKAGSVRAVNMALLGALIQTCILPVSVESVRSAIETKTARSFVPANLKAFELGFEAAKNLAAS
jgi:indolepyruvate ferredoxin oxidoreductase beta subunit